MPKWQNCHTDQRTFFSSHKKTVFAIPCYVFFVVWFRSRQFQVIFSALLSRQLKPLYWLWIESQFILFDLSTDQKKNRGPYKWIHRKRKFFTAFSRLFLVKVWTRWLRVFILIIFFFYFLPSHRVSESAVGQTVACNWLSLSHSFKKTRHKPGTILYDYYVHAGKYEKYTHNNSKETN